MEQPELIMTKITKQIWSAYQRSDYWSSLPCDWPSTAWAYSEQETETGLGHDPTAPDSGETHV